MHAGLDDGRSFIKLSGLRFSRPADLAHKFAHNGDLYTGLVEVVVFERSQQHLIGYASQVCTGSVWHVPEVMVVLLASGSRVSV